ncbi:MAG: hypothetical protein WCL29_01965 [Pseudomonadota bacterium]
MSNNQTNQPGSTKQDGEIVDSALDAVSGGQGTQPARVIEPIVVTATRLPKNTASMRVVDPIVVTATKLTPNDGGTHVASAKPTAKSS